MFAVMQLMAVWIKMATVKEGTEVEKQWSPLHWIKMGIQYTDVLLAMT
jgi:hypothetical protein